MADHDHDSADDTGPPARSRLDRPRARPYRELKRSFGRLPTRDRKQRPIAELMGRAIAAHGLTDEVRQQAVCLYWFEIAGERIASKTFPIAFTEGVLHISATSSAWVHEMQFFKSGLIAKINAWVDTQRTWLGPPPLVLDLRVVLGSQRREVLVDPDYVRRLRTRTLQRMRARTTEPPQVSDTERQAIIADTSGIEDDELRALIEGVRTRWNR